MQTNRLHGDALAEVVEAAATGDPAAWDVLVGEFAEMIGAVTRAHRVYGADAADVAQTTWLRLLEHLRRLHDPARVGAWLATTARRECLRVRRQRVRCFPFAHEAVDRQASEVAPSEAILARERDDAVRLGVRRLRASDQALLRLLTADPPPPYEQIAASLDMPVGSIGPTRQRALARLRQELDSQGTLTLIGA
jgi:RNA polymerase sigma factor (sigma-70 family)